MKLIKTVITVEHNGRELEREILLTRDREIQAYHVAKALKSICEELGETLSSETLDEFGY